MKKVSFKTGTIKTRLIVIPLTVVFLVILGIGIFSSYFLRSRLLNEVESNGLYLAKLLVDNVEDNYRSLDIINNSLDNTLIAAGKRVFANEDSLTNDFLKQLAEDLQVEQISYFNNEGVIIYCNVDDYIGWQPPEGHPVNDFIKSNDKELIENIREDAVSGHFVKYANLRGPRGTFVQVGVNANVVHDLTESFSYQTFLDELSADNEIYYGLIIDKNAQIIAHNNKEEIGLILDDEGSISAAINGEVFVQEWHYEADGIDVLDISYPLIINDEHIGGISIGFSLDNIKNSIRQNIIFVVAITLLAFIVLGAVLYRASSYIVKIIARLKDQMKHMENGDFSNEVAQDLISKKDELGEISSAVAVMQNEVRSVIKNVVDTSQNLAASSQQLTATTEQSATAADEVARAIEDIATGASEQAKDTEIGVFAITELGEIVIQNEEYIKRLVHSSDIVDALTNEGLEMLKILVEKTDISSKSSKEVQQVIIDANESAEKITSASSMIQSIADQTNLLALNAAIEAARAGESGRGFAVVADEIRKLAEESNKFTAEIGNIVEELSNKTLTAVKTMEELEQVVLSQTESADMTNNKFMGIAESMKEMEKDIEGVNKSGHEITKKKEQVITIMENLSAISEENAAGTQEASASVEEQTAAMGEIANSSEQLAQMAEHLSGQVKKFKF